MLWTSKCKHISMHPAITLRLPRRHPRHGARHLVDSPGADGHRSAPDWNVLLPLPPLPSKENVSPCNLQNKLQGVLSNVLRPFLHKFFHSSVTRTAMLPRLRSGAPHRRGEVSQEKEEEEEEEVTEEEEKEEEETG
ncbi:hypothetical protein TREES_T100016742 [Tupaia chinensis]|uniref:Uncharacterized protein n=1 Tax=Tupaia chinensis TaxID=246437 RepID=L9L329_TUPCH|nr:hypothetical protein TREES_T100016742 [Tupaia chinensis]